MTRDLPDLDPYTRGPAPHDPSPAEAQGFNPAKGNGASAPTSVPSAKGASASSAFQASASESSVPSVSSVVKRGSDSLPKKIAAAKTGSLKDARELLDLLNAV